MQATPAQHMVAGTAGSVVALALTFPLDAIRTRLQAEESSKGNRGPLGTLVDIANSHEGLKGLYTGLGGNLKIMAVAQAVYFFWYNSLKNTVEKRTGHALTVVENLMLAYTAGAINAGSTCPLWSVATRLKLRAKARAKAAEDAGGDEEKGSDGDDGDEADDGGDTIVGQLKAIYKEGGVKGLYNGLGPALLLCTNPAIQFLVYEQLKARVSAKPSGVQAFAMGAIAKTVSTVLTYPLQVWQVREQSSAKSERGLKLIRHMLESEGVPAFYKGMSSKLLQTVLTSAFLFLFYERFLRMVLAVSRAVKKG